MIIFVNGSFGVGKTTVCKLLVNQIPKNTIFDPETVGFVFRRLPKFVSLKDRNTWDYQDISLWRRLTAFIALIIRNSLNRTVIIPMTFCKLEYLNEIRSLLLRHDSILVHHFCLIASIKVIYERLKQKGVHPLSVEGQWVYPRAAKCCEIHLAPEFNRHVNTNQRSPSEVAEEILKNILPA